jgi:hypothetical protein
MASSLREANEPSHLDKPCDEGDDQRSSDLCAQWKAADAAKSAANATWFFGALGSLIGSLTLAAAWSAAKWAKKAAEHTEVGAKEAGNSVIAARRANRNASEANDISREANYVQSRPYLYLVDQSVAYQHMRSVGHVGDTGDIVLHFKNFGQTPARRVILRAKVVVGGVWNAGEPVDLEDTATVHLGDYPPNHAGKRDGYTVTGLKAADADIRAGTASVFIVGQIQYGDGIGRDYFTNFRLASTQGEYPAGQFSVCPTGNEAH